jgi:hypothetical protein
MCKPERLRLGQEQGLGKKRNPLRKEPTVLLNTPSTKTT